MLVLSMMNRPFGHPARRLLILSLLALLALPMARAQEKKGAARTESTSATVTRTAATTTTTASGALIPVAAANASATTKTTTLPVVEQTSTTAISAPILERTELTTATAAATAATATTTTTALPPPPMPELTPLPATETAATTGTAPLGEGEKGQPRAARPGAAESKNIYLRDLKPLQIFDPAKGEALTPLQRAAKLFSERKEARERLSLAHIQNLLTFDYELEGANENQVYQEALIRALKSASARIYFANYFLLGRDLLEPYLKQNGQPFIARASVLDHRYLTKDRIAMKVRISVNLDGLYKDLEQKQFIAEPNLRPIVAVHLQEIVEGRRAASAGARGRIERTMERNMFRVFSNKMKQPGLDVDISGAPSLLKTARLEAQRNNVDVLITGTMAVRPIRQGNILYDHYAFEEADVTLKMYRVDTGELIDEAHDRYSATSGSNAESIKLVLDAMVVRVTQHLADQLTQMWGSTMLNEGYRIMFSGVSPGDVANIHNFLRTLSPDVHIYQKSYYGDVLVVNVVGPQTTAEQLEAFLRGSTEPQFSVRKVDKHQFILGVL